MALIAWAKTPEGMVLTGCSATLDEIRLKSGLPLGYARAYIPTPANVRILIEVDGKVVGVAVADSVTPKVGEVVQVEVRTFVRETTKVEHVPVDPALALAKAEES